ncbi:cytidine deaminase [Corynebacterium sp. ES2794-CONJ1]|nr:MULTISPECIES: cytidine deaminase [unclassified Corynebacterium]MCS4490253.1 cytidine deaminase [Corynebacterium sp. ES2775-CONJ]MCS4491936.1 cytidine deaminase [Corynebacterium sp. ES2715-CONJ3]MCS4532041.1 cytidine deaminase [Corynebacterium sp. ES2730-CONJ]MCU9519442.1 cytidine deaminase [Corynebacterium sp. ES2794-CONJ1]
MTMSPQELIAAAKEAAHHAYAPYSNFEVGAAILTTDGTVFTGCNVENASYGLTLCAERNAATTMIATTKPDSPRQIHSVAIVGLKASPCWPCGSCRQVLREFGCQEVFVEGPTGEVHSLSFTELLPHSFGPEHLDT